MRGGGGSRTEREGLGQKNHGRFGTSPVSEGRSGGRYPTDDRGNLEKRQTRTTRRVVISPSGMGFFIDALRNRCPLRRGSRGPLSVVWVLVTYLDPRGPRGNLNDSLKFRS